MEYDIQALQRMFGPETAHDAASHKPAMMNRKDNKGKSHSLVKLPNGNYRSSDVNEASVTEGYHPEINDGDQVEFKRDSAYYIPGTWTVSQSDDRNRCWIGDEDNRGWYVDKNELELTDTFDDDDFDVDFETELEFRRFAVSNV